MACVTTLYGVDGSGCPVTIDEPPGSGYLPIFTGTCVEWVHADDVVNLTDVFLSAAAYDDASNVLTLTLNNGSQVVVNLQDLIPITTDGTSTTGTGTTADPVKGYQMESHVLNPAVYVITRPDGTSFNLDVCADLSNCSINSLGDVDMATTLPVTGQIIEWDGTNWVPADPPTVGVTDTDAPFALEGMPQQERDDDQLITDNVYRRGQTGFGMEISDLIDAVVHIRFNTIRELLLIDSTLGHDVFWVDRLGNFSNNIQDDGFRNHGAEHVFFLRDGGDTLNVTVPPRLPASPYSTARWAMLI